MGITSVLISLTIISNLNESRVLSIASQKRFSISTNLFTITRTKWVHIVHNMPQKELIT